MTLRVVILAAGLGTRMKSSLPKMMHTLCGRPMILFGLDAAEGLSREKPVLVVGHGAELVREAAGGRAEFVEQPRLLGTADALRCTEAALKGRADHLLVFHGDFPLLRPETLKPLADAGTGGSTPLAMLTGRLSDVRTFGRILRDATGRVVRIVEEHEATAQQKEIHEANLGGYIFRADWLWPALAQVKTSPKGEYYLTDLVAMAAGEGGVLAINSPDEEDWIGVNDRAQLARAEAVLRRRINTRWMEAGVAMQDPATAYISFAARIGEGTAILANTHLEGRTTVGRQCVIGPNTILRDSTVGDRSRVEASIIENFTVEEGASVGPFAHVSAKAHRKRGVPAKTVRKVKPERK